MGIPYKAFYCKCIVFSLCIYMSLALMASQARAYDSLFVVKGVKVDVTDKDSVSAQQQAFGKAQAIAFSILTKRMVAEADVDNFQRPSPDIISSMIKDYEVENEQLSAVRYVGEYTFRFNEKAVSQFFSVTGVQYTDKSSKPLLVLPILQVNGQNTIWSDRNLWMRAWSRARLSVGVVPIEVPIGDLDDIADIDDNDALRYERKSLDRMLLRYGASEAAIMIAVPDAQLSGLNDDDAAKGSLRVSIYRTDRGVAERVNDIVIDAENGENVSALYDRAVMRANSALQKDWKNKTTSSASQSQNYLVRLPLKSLNELTRAQNILKTVPGLTNVSVVSLKPIEAKLAFVYRGDEMRLRDVLGRTPLTLGDMHTAPKRFVNGASNAPDVYYDLFYQRTKSKTFFQPNSDILSTEDESNIHTF